MPMGRSMHSAISAFDSDPFLTLFFKMTFDRVRDEIDEFVACFHSNNEEINEYNASVFKGYPNYRYKIVTGIGELGIALDEIYPLVQGDRLMVIDSDNYVLKKGVIKKFFQELDIFSAIGSGGNCVQPLELARDIASRSGFGYARINTFMAFFDKLKLDKLNSTFRRKFYRTGDVIEPINYRVNLEGLPQNKMCLDTMGLLSLVYAKEYGRIKLIECRDPNLEWIHMGGLSSMSNRFLDGGNNHSIMGVAQQGGRFDFKFNKWRLAIHLFIYEMTVDKCPLKDFNKKYIDSLNKKIIQSGFTRDDLENDLNNLKAIWAQPA